MILDQHDAGPVGSDGAPWPVFLLPMGTTSLSDVADPRLRMWQSRVIPVKVCPHPRVNSLVFRSLQVGVLTNGLLILAESTSHVGRKPAMLLANRLDLWVGDRKNEPLPPRPGPKHLDLLDLELQPGPGLVWRGRDVKIADRFSSGLAREGSHEDPHLRLHLYPEV